MIRNIENYQKKSFVQRCLHFYWTFLKLEGIDTCIQSHEFIVSTHSVIPAMYRVLCTVLYHPTDKLCYLSDSYCLLGGKSTIVK